MIVAYMGISSNWYFPLIAWGIVYFLLVKKYSFSFNNILLDIGRVRLFLAATVSAVVTFFSHGQSLYYSIFFFLFSFTIFIYGYGFMNKK